MVRCPSFGWAWASILYHSIVSNISVNRCPSLTVTGCRTERLVQHCGRWPASDVTVDVIGDVTPLLLLLLAQILYTAMTSDNRYHSRRTLSIYAASVRQSSQRRLLLSSTLSAIFLTLLACGSVYVTTRCPSVCLSVCLFHHAPQPQRVCCCGPRKQAISIDCCTARLQQARPPIYRSISTAARRSAEADLGMFSMFGRTRAPTKGHFFHFYRAMLCIRGTSHGPVSVRHKSVFY